MNDDKKNQKAIWVSPEIHEKFKKHCQEQGLKFGAAVEKAMLDYLIKHKSG